MKRRTGTLAAAAMLAMLTALRGPAFAQATDPEGYGDGYGSGDYGRIRSADSGATILRANTESGESDRASVNAPLFPGDLLRTADGQRVEVQLAGGSMVRIDTGADVLFQSMPNPSAKFQDNTVIGLKEAGAQRVYAGCVHPVLSGPAIDRINGSLIEKIFCTNTLPFDDKVARCQILAPLSVGPLLAEAIHRIHEGASVSSLFV